MISPLQITRKALPSICLLLLACAYASIAGEPTNELHFVFFTDVHARTEWDTPQALDWAAQAINEQTPDLIVGGGDYITEGFESCADVLAPRWEAYFKFQQALKAPVEAAIGNHDLVAAKPLGDGQPLADPRSVFRSKFGVESTYRSFDTNGYHFILLDPVEVSSGPLPYEGRMGESQIAWLRQDLAGVETSTPIVVVTHIPLKTGYFKESEVKGELPPPNRVVVNAGEVLECFRGYDPILVLQGHLHVAEKLAMNEVLFVTGGAVCGQWWRGSWKGTPEGFYVIDLKGRGVEERYLTYGWKARRPADQ
ncbi:MAG: hypothetical protein A2X46_18190 [Lentisphaerae bacterium GWF2_57_35]|nr:MAG: hypothetical protein A2X46_18190 [Lentisphaerae bacterium GWF2_57_35]